jgi:homospermidine synthase
MRGWQVTAFDGRILVIGLGAVSRCTLPLLFEHVAAQRSQYTVIDFGDVEANARWVTEQGARFAADRIERETYAETLGRHAGPGDLIVDLAWNTGTADLLEWCRAHDVRYVNASLEVWEPYAGMGTSPPQERTLYARHMELRDRIARWGDNDGPSAVLDHGANPGLVSHFTKAALADIADACLEDGSVDGAARDAIEAARTDGAWNRLAQALGVRRSTSPNATPRSATSRSARTSSSTRGRSRGSTKRASRPRSSAGGRTRRSCRGSPSRTTEARATRSASRTPAAGRGCVRGCRAETSSAW